MKKLLISVLIVLLFVLAYFAIFQGISLGKIKILSVKEINKENDLLDNEISQANMLIKKEYPSKQENLSSEVSNLLNKKEEYFNIAKVSTESEIEKANTEETYLLEYLWVRVGRHARFKGVNIEMVFSSANAGEQNMQDLKFTVQGQYVGIIEFIYALEDDSELNFRIENFKMTPMESNLVATFNVKNVRVKDESTNNQPSVGTNGNNEGGTEWGIES